MKLANILFLILFFPAAKAQDIEVSIGKEITFYSDVLKEERRLWIHVPDPYIYYPSKYPVLYLLDGEAHFYSTVGMMLQLSSINGNSVFPEMIVVAIHNTDRTRDFTPTQNTDFLFMDSTMTSSSGGGEKFSEFLEKELLPFIDSTYPTEPFRMLIGHSLGALFVMDTWQHHRALFNAYVALDPAIWWNKNELLTEIENSPPDEEPENSFLYLGVANTIAGDFDTATVRQDTSMFNKHIQPILALNRYLQTHPQPGTSYMGRFYPNETHTSMPFIASYDALRFIFDFYDFDVDAYMLDQEDMLDDLIYHFELVSEKMGYSVLPNETLVNLLGMFMMQLDNLSLAEELLQLNAENYPLSYNVFDSLGDYYVFIGDEDRAIENYKKSLQLDEDSMSGPKLDQLIGD